MKLRSILSTLATGAILVLSTGTAHAGPSSLSLSPASGSVQIGSSLNISIIETGDNVNVVTVNLNYDASKLSCNGVGGGAFANTISASCGGGVVKISRYTTPGQPGLNGSQVVGTVNFTALVGTGTTSLTFGASQVASAGVNTLAGASGGTYNLTSPVVVTPPTTGGSTGNSGTTGSSSSPANGSGTPANSTAGTDRTKKPTANNSQSSSSDSAMATDQANNSNDTKKSVNQSGQVAGAETNDKDDASEKPSAIRNFVISLGLLALAAVVFVLGRRHANANKAKAAATMVAKKKSTKKPVAKKTTRKK